MTLAELLMNFEKKRVEKNNIESQVFEHYDLCSEVDRKIENIKTTPPLKADDYIRVSSLGYMCSREEVLRSRLNITKVERQTAQMMRIFNLGTVYHTMIQNDYLGRNDFIWGNWKCNVCGSLHRDCYMPKSCQHCQRGRESLIYEEYDLKSENFKITGHPDGIIFKNGKKWLLELKTINDFGFKSVQANLAPKRDHLIQANMYMGMLKIYQAIVVYFNKDSGVWRQFYIKFDTQLAKEKLDQIMYMRQCIADHSKPLPARIVCDKISCLRAKNCPVVKQCFAT